jgi:hypothetical protein
MSATIKSGQADQHPDNATKQEGAKLVPPAWQNDGAPLPDESTIASYAANNVPHCKKCGQQICSDKSGLICPYEAAGCPVVIR